MELCDESLTSFLERSSEPLAYDLQLNISQDIALALVYLHSNDLIHRDLTGNNVLMIAGTQAKITDFGMSKLVNINPRSTALPLCPGNVLYMPPEALDGAVDTYTPKLDIFSFGVLLIQIVTRKFPNPTERFCIVSCERYGEVRQVITEAERREAHLKRIPENHTLKSLALYCLKAKENERPSALQLSERLSELKEIPHCMHQAQSSHKTQPAQKFMTISEQEKETQKLTATKQLHLVTTDALQSVAQEDVTKTTWKEGKNAPDRMRRGAAVVHGNTAYLIPAASGKIYTYNNFQGQEEWSVLPENPNKNCGLSVIDSLLTSVGGFNNGPTSTLLSLVGDDEKKHWSIIFPAMPTQRTLATCITTERVLVVAGGYAGSSLGTVEVMKISTKQWSTACPLPRTLKQFSGVLCGDTLYLAGGFTGFDAPSKSVFTCALCDLWKPQTLGSKMRQKLSHSKGNGKKSNAWKEICHLPVPHATLVTYDDHLLAIDGFEHYRYDSDTNTWNVVSQFKNKRSECFAVILPPDQLIILGGYNNNTVEMLAEQ